MKFSGLNGHYTGVAVPVTSLRGDDDMGVGEFADLVEFASFCRDTGLEVLQILPINDSGFDSSPYSALSAYALHPIYIRLTDLPELADSAVAEAVEPYLGELREAASRALGVQYHSVLDRKLEALRAVYSAAQKTIDNDRQLDTWIEDNPWVKPYAVFRMLKDRHEQAAWWQWSELTEPSTQDIEANWSDPANYATVRFYAWLQLRLEEQLVRAAGRLESMGIYLKGDLPILMNEDSADVWLHRDIFRLELRAGAPPDMFSRFGQNWGFPVYNWKAMAENNYGWWRARLRQADKFFHMFRIDHVLGFFRIWAVPAENETGTMGFFSPAHHFTRGDLYAVGFDDGRIRWLSEPHLSRERIESVLGGRTDEFIDYIFEQIGDEDLYRFSERVEGERWLKSLGLQPEQITGLIDLYGDRALVQIDGEHFAPTWRYLECERYLGLYEDERAAFEELVVSREAESEFLWEQHGHELLGFMREEVEMLPCAEDLGVVPNCVPKVLADLGILGLRVPRWAREWDEDGEPFTPPKDYPYLTVCAASVHDTSTLRGWWYEAPEAREAFWTSLGLKGDPPAEYTPDVALRVLNALNSQVASAIAMYEIQDFFSLSYSLIPENPDDERINTPGTYNSVNWSYRMPVSISTLFDQSSFMRGVREIVDSRRTKQ